MATTLAAGDIAIVGMRGRGTNGNVTNNNPNNDDSFAFVVLKPIEAGTQIRFTDREWVGGANGHINPNDNSLVGEGVYVYTAPANIAVGTVVTISFDGGLPGGMSFPSFNGDQILAYQGSESAPTFVDVFQDRGPFLGAGQGSDATTNNRTEVPPGVSEGTTAVAVNVPDGEPGADRVNWSYTGPTSGSHAQLLAAIHNPSNWAGATTAATSTAYPTSFSVGAPPPPAEIIVRGNGVEIVDGDMTPGYADHSQFGGTAVAGGVVDRTFTIANQGGEQLNIGQITVTGANAADFQVVTPPAASVGAGGSTTFTVRFDPSSGGLKTASIAIANNDSNENPYNFDIRGSGIAAAQTALGAGDIAIVGYNNPAETQFAFVLLKDIVAGTVIKFTDAGWDGNALATTENAIQWVAPSDLPFGTVVQFDELNYGPNFQVTNDGGYFTNPNPRFDLEFGGDQIFAYVGAASSPTFLGGIHTGGTTFDADYNGMIRSSEVPAGLTDGVNVLSYANSSGPFVSGVYVGSTTGDRAALLAKINNEANWQGSGNSQTLPSSTFGNGGNQPAEIDVQYSVGGVPVADGDTTPVATDGTQFDAQDAIGGSQQHSFVIRNLGDQTLNLGQVQVSGANSGDFLVSIGTTTLNATQQTTLTVTFAPTGVGARTATITIPSNDSDEPSYDFVIRGLGRDPAQTLSAGDIAFAGFDSVANRFAFVAMTDIAAGTSIKFTDGGWTGAAYATTNGEGATEWVAPSAIPAGTVIVYDGRLPNGGPDWTPTDTGYFNGSFNPEVSGDQIIAYQGPAGGATTNIAAIHYDSSTFDNAYNGGVGSSQVPPGLTDGVNAISFGNGATNYQHGVYTGPKNLPFDQLLLAMNDEQNWSGNNAGVTFPTEQFGDRPGVAFNDAFVATEDDGVLGDVFADNGSGADSDPDGPPLQVGAVNGSTAVVGQQITLQSGALLTLNANGTFDYDPNDAYDALPAAGSGAANATATDTFQYTLVNGGTATVTLTITGVDSDDMLTGTPLADVLRGGVGADTLRGLAGADRLDGGTGQDTMEGGQDNDIYYVDNLGDVVTELDGQGADTVYASVDWTLTAGSYVEQLRADYGAAAAGLALTGNALNNLLLGGAANDTLDGGDGNDRLIGGLGADAMTGGLGDDSFYVDDAGDSVVELADGGADVVYSSVDWTLTDGAHVEQLRANYGMATTGVALTGNALANFILGGGADDTLDGGAGKDRLDGGLGADAMTGGAGADSFYVDDAGDTVVELASDAGKDVVYASVDWAMGADASIEQLRANYGAGPTGIALSGNDLANQIFGGAQADALYGGGGNDRLTGGLGADEMTGGEGNDTYYVDNADDVVTEIATQGTDTVYASTNWTMTDGSSIEMLRALYTSVADGLYLQGNDLANSIFGGARKDILDGGAGADLLTGGGGADIFCFTSPLGSGNTDRVVDFSSAQSDKLQLSSEVFFGAPSGGVQPLDSSLFVANDTGAATTAEQRIVYETDTGKLFFDADGSGDTAAVQFAQLVNKAALSVDDIFVA